MSTHTGPEVVSVERIDGTGIIVEFSDSTYAEYGTEQLLAAAPDRLKADSPAPGLDPRTPGGA